MQKELFKHGPLYKTRFDIVHDLTPLIKDGDILFRLGGEKFLFLSFSKLVAKMTESKWSHASIAMVRNNEVWVLEVNDRGTLEYKLIDWFDYCTSGTFAIYRVKNLMEEQRKSVRKECEKFLLNDPDYDFTFNDPGKFYCTESVVEIYKNCGIELVKPDLMKNLISPYYYNIVKPINWIVSKFSNKCLPVNEPVYVVGNEKKGILSSDKLQCIYDYS